jgi:hypothetical protein
MSVDRAAVHDVLQLHRDVTAETATTRQLPLLFFVAMEDVSDP